MRSGLSGSPREVSCLETTLQRAARGAVGTSAHFPARSFWPLNFGVCRAATKTGSERRTQLSISWR